MPEIWGGCRCGAVRYKLALDALPSTYACHCLDCQTWSGSAFSQQTFLPEAALTVTGPVVVYEFTTPSGRTSTQRLCGVCHARIYNSNSARPNVAIVRAGTLDRSNELAAHRCGDRPLPGGLPRMGDRGHRLRRTGCIGFRKEDRDA